jgi:hypothetical protein
VAAHTDAIFKDDIFDVEPMIEDAELVPYQVNVAPPMTTVDMPFTCSTKFLHLSVHAGKMLVTMLLQECMVIQEARVLDPICRVINTSCSSIDKYTNSAQGKCGVLLSADSKSLIPVQGIITTSLMDIRSIFSDVIAVAKIERRFWDLGLARCSGPMKFGRSYVAFHWNSGFSEDLLFMWFMRHSIDFILAQYHELHIAWPCFIVLPQCNKSVVSLQWAR